MKKYFIAGIFFLSAAVFSFGQDVHFSQYNLTPLVINPAQAGAYKNFEAIINYKNQWTSISPNAYKTMMVEADGRFKQKQWKTKWLAGGINFYTDKAGDGNMKTNSVSGSFGYHTQLNDQNTLGGCLMAGFTGRSIDYTKLQWDEQYQNGSYSSSNPSGETVNQTSNKFGYPDFGMGILYQYNKGQMYSTANDMFIIHSGLSLFHLNKPKYSFYGNTDEKLYVKVIGHVDAIIGIKNTNFAVVPGFLYMGQGPSHEVLPGCYFRYMLREESKFTGYVKGASIMVGTHLRVKDAFIPSVQLEVAEYTLGISYDMNVSGLKTATSGKGGFEISLRYGNPNPFLYKSAASFQ
ncbi:MAG: PorP/SprF family type IX secretion system membrane protein [Bacteroidetes bacterium]|nr:PorP/SprF family type IX secretion system membrane protein [Bacteroidota bacterium]